MPWSMPKGTDRRNVSISINKIYLGKTIEEILREEEKTRQHDDNDNNEPQHFYRIKTPTISLETYQELVAKLSTSDNNNNDDDNKNNDNKNDNDNDNSNCKEPTASTVAAYEYKYLKLCKQTKILKKSDVKNLINFALTICPACQWSNCVYCKKRNKFRKYMKIYNERFKTSRVYPKYVKCFQCYNVFRTRFNVVTCDNYKSTFFRNCLGWQCGDCRDGYNGPYSEFLRYLKATSQSATAGITLIKDNDRNGDDDNGKDNDDDDDSNNKISDNNSIYRRLSEAAKRDINYTLETLYYGIRVTTNGDEAEREGTNTTDTTNKTIIIPPLAFLTDTNRPASFYDKLLRMSNSEMLDIKTKYGSVNSRSQGGKNSIFRNNCLNKRHVESGRLVIVPRYGLQPHQCLLPESLYRRLNCPKYIVGHRYPTLDIRSLMYLEVIGTWEYCCLGISTAVVRGCNADFDGDCFHVIPANNLASQAELIQLCHPCNNMIVEKQLRVNFDHDEIQTIYSEFGLTADEIHSALLTLATNTSSSNAYRVFCNLRTFCHWVWENKSIATVSFRDFAEIYRIFDAESTCCSGSNSNSCCNNNTPRPSYSKFIGQIFPSIPPRNGIKELICSQSSRFSVDHLWQLFGEINRDAKTGFLNGMTKSALINMALISRNAIMKELSYFGYTHIKLTHCSKTITVGYDGRLHTTDGTLVARNVADIY